MSGRETQAGITATEIPAFPSEHSFPNTRCGSRFLSIRFAPIFFTVRTLLKFSAEKGDETVSSSHLPGPLSGRAENPTTQERKAFSR